MSAKSEGLTPEGMTRAPGKVDCLLDDRVDQGDLLIASLRRSALECVWLATALGSEPRAGPLHITQGGGKPTALQSAAARREKPPRPSPCTFPAP